MQAIVLCGGLGKRLSSVIDKLPKPMAPINGEPFLSILLSYLVQHGVEEIVFACGYKHKFIRDYFGNSFKGARIIYSIESHPLGSGGAILKAFKLVTDDRALVLNGDTFFDVDLQGLYYFDITADVCVSLKYITGSSRYNFIESDQNNNLVQVLPKKTISTGFVNGGVMVIKRKIFDTYFGEENFGLEDYIFSDDKLAKTKVYKSDGYFIDIGIPQDYKKAQNELKQYQDRYSR